MNERPYGDNVLVVCKPGTGSSCDLHVKTRPSPNFAWATKEVFNDIEDDNAAEKADRLAHELQGQYERADLHTGRRAWPFMVQGA